MATTSNGSQNPARSPRIAELLSSNDPPLAVEEETFRALVLESQTQLTGIVHQIAALLASLDSLLLRRDQMHTIIRDHKAVLNPIRRLPADILFTIFSFCTPSLDVRDMDGKHHYDSLDVRNSPWVLGRVCRRWRSLLAELPTLWSSVNVVIDAKSVEPRPIHHSQYLLGRLLQNAKSCPLSVGLYSGGKLLDANPLLHTITPYSDRWRELRVFFPKRESFKHLGYTKGCLSSLQTLHLQAGPHAVTMHETCDTFAVAPQLRELIVNNFRDVVRGFSLPWSQITRYQCCSSGVGHLTTLKEMPHLEECSLGFGSRIPEDVPVPLPKVRLASLKKLHIKDTGKTIGSLLTHLWAPSLQYLKLVSCVMLNDFGPLVAHDFNKFIARSACPLVELDLPWLPSLTDTDVLSLLTSTPTIQKIDLASDILTDHFIAQLRYQNDVEPIAPNLHSITIESLGERSIFDPELLLDMVESRWDIDDGVTGDTRQVKVVRLRCLELNWDGHLPALLSADPRLEYFRSEGLKISCWSSL